MKYFYIPAAFILLISTTLFSCKKSAAPLVTFMKLDTNGKAVNYNSCFTAEFNSYGQPETKIVSQGGSGYFTIILNHAPGYLKTGQVYAAQTIKSDSTDLVSSFVYEPGGLDDGGYGFPSSEDNPIGSVTLTEVSSTSIKGTFSAGIFSTADGSDLLYTVTNGSFCSGPSAYTVVIQEGN